MVYRHFKGGDYEFIALAYIEATLEPVVVYRSLTSGETFTRPAAEFFGAVAVNTDGTCVLLGSAPTALKYVPRFTPLGRLAGRKSQP